MAFDSQQSERTGDAPDVPEDAVVRAMSDWLDLRDRRIVVEPDDFASRYGNAAEEVLSLISISACLVQSATHVASEESGFSTTGIAGGLTDIEPTRRDDFFLSGDESRRAFGLPRRFGRYELRSCIDQGRMGRVFAAWDTTLERRVAIKIPRLDLEGRDTGLERFYREARAVSGLKHPNLCTVFDVGEIDGLHFLSMEFVEGETALTRLRRAPLLTTRQCVEIVRKIAGGMAVAHAAGVLHRDLKPSNVILNAAGEPVVVDFGLAWRRASPSEARLTHVDKTAGTPAYMSPEQARGEEPGPAGDIYSLGVTLYEMLTGTPPFSGTTAEVFQQILTAEPAPPSRCRMGLSPSLDAICMRMMRKSRTERFGSMHEVVEAVDEWLCSSPLIGEDEFRSVQHPLQQLKGSIERATASRRGVGRRSTVNAMRACVGVVAVFAAVALLQSLRTPSDGSRELDSASRSDSLRSPEGSTAAIVATSHADSIDSPLPRTPFAVLARPPEGLRSDPVRSAVPGEPKSAVVPFTASQAKRHQEEWARHLGVRVEFENAVGMRFRLIPPGQFVMGSTAAEVEASLKELPEGGLGYWEKYVASEGPPRQVILSRPCYFGVHEVTQSQYEQILGTNPSSFRTKDSRRKELSGQDTSNHPVDGVNWNNAALFCDALSRSEKLTPFYSQAEKDALHGALGYRLPTEAEWEFACRAGTTTKYWSGDDEPALRRAGWFGGNSGNTTHAVGQLAANPFGLFDVHGSVMEWCGDFWDPEYFASASGMPVVDPRGPTTATAFRVNRGGDFAFPALNCRSGRRHGEGPHWGDERIGIRVVLSIEAMKAANLGSD